MSTHSAFSSCACSRTLPLAWVRALGWLLGRLLYCRRRAAPADRRCVTWRCAFRSGAPRAARAARAARSSCVSPQAWLDRSWLWHGKPEVTRGAAQADAARSRNLRAARRADDAVRAALHRHGRRLDRAHPTACDRSFTGIYTGQSQQGAGRVDAVAGASASARAGLSVAPTASRPSSARAAHGRACSTCCPT